MGECFSFTFRKTSSSRQKVVCNQKRRAVRHFTYCKIMYLVVRIIGLYISMLSYSWYCILWGSMKMPARSILWNVLSGFVGMSCASFCPSLAQHSLGSVAADITPWLYAPGRVITESWLYSVEATTTLWINSCQLEEGPSQNDGILVSKGTGGGLS